MKRAADFFSSEQKDTIVKAIEKAELNTSGEIRLHVELNCKTDAFDRAVAVFNMLNMHKTELRNGVLFYIAINDRKFAIIGDSGINNLVSNDFWDSTKELMLQYFKQGEVVQGIVEGIIKAGEQLKHYFPYSTNDVNELSNDISFEN